MRMYRAMRAVMAALAGLVGIGGCTETEVAQANWLLGLVGAVVDLCKTGICWGLAIATCGLIGGCCPKTAADWLVRLLTCLVLIVGIGAGLTGCSQKSTVQDQQAQLTMYRDFMRDVGFRGEFAAAWDGRTGGGLEQRFMIDSGAVVQFNGTVDPLGAKLVDQAHAPATQPAAVEPETEVGP